MKTIFTTHMLFLLLVIPNFGWAQYITVSGYVSNEANGKALESVSIFESNSKIGTITNQNGFYKLVLEKGNFDLNISNNGFKSYTKNLSLDSDTTLIVKLQPKAHSKNRQKKDADLRADGKTDKKVATNKGWKFF